MSSPLENIRETALHQGGIFAKYQVDATDQVLSYHVKNRNLERLARGIYRLTDLPRSDHQDYIVAYLWSREEGVLSHQTALSIHDLSDVLPNHIHLTLPESWRSRQLKIPDNYRLHYADLTDDDTRWFSAAKVTTPERTIKDVALAGLDPDLVEQAISQATTRGLVPDDFQHQLLRYLILRQSND